MMLLRSRNALLLLGMLLTSGALMGLTPFQISLRVQPGEIASSSSNIPPDRVVQTVAKARREIAQNPNSPEGYLLLGTALRIGGNLDAASRALDRALELDPKLSAAWLQKGLISLEGGTLASTEALFEKAVDANPSNAQAQLQLAVTLLREGDFQKAQFHLEGARHSDPQSAGAYDGMGFIDTEKGDPTAAAQQFRKAIALRSPYPEAQENLGEALLELGNAADARKAFENALASGLQDASMASYGLASALKRLGLTAQAEAEFAKARELMRQRVATDRAQNENDRGLQLWHSGNLTEAALAFREAITADAHYAEARNNLGGVLWQLKDSAGAEQEFAAAVRDKPDFAQARNNLGNVLVNAGAVDQAITQFRAALAAQPGFASAHLDLAVALLKKADKQGAETELRQALDLDPTMGPAHLELGLLLIPASGELTSGARYELTEGLHLDPELWSDLPAPVYSSLILGN
jgi:tetratricopeptide (TPR) repeat protein